MSLTLPSLKKRYICTFEHLLLLNSTFYKIYQEKTSEDSHQYSYHRNYNVSSEEAGRIGMSCTISCVLKLL